MRAKTRRLYKKVMHNYGVAFGFHEPYQFLLDSSFCKQSNDAKLDIQKDLDATLSTPTRPMVTECVIQELKKQGEHGAAASTKAFHLLKCKHIHKAVSSATCVLEMIGETNARNYGVATQDDALREKLHAIAGVPIVKVKNALIILEPMSPATKQAVQSKEHSKTMVSASEAKQLNIKPAEPTAMVHRKRKAKAPNPLSMKKKKKTAPPPPKNKATPSAQKSPAKKKTPA
ncbi:Fcf1-domain-containing protein [Gongronella butleri]|nr:Fcf1-domain-containing protein [Gongronella butleri]